MQRIAVVLFAVNLACAEGSGELDDAADAEVKSDAAIGDGGEISLGRFEAIADLAAGPRQETAVVALGGEVFVIGGYDADRQFGALVEIYDPGSNSWRRAADLPVPMHHANAAAAAGKIYVIGFLGAGFVESDRSFVYDPAADRWTELAPMPPARRRGASVTISLDDKIYLIGGLRGLSPVADADEYDPITGELRPLPPLPRPTDHAAGGGLNGKLFVAGGRAGGVASHTDRLDIFDLSSGTWSEGRPMPTARGGAAAAILGGRLFVMGGEGNREQAGMRLFDQVEAYEAAANRWVSLVPMDPPRHGMGAAALSDRIIIPGGATVEGFGATASSQVFIP